MQYYGIYRGDVVDDVSLYYRQIYCRCYPSLQIDFCLFQWVCALIYLMQIYMANDFLNPRAMLIGLVQKAGEPTQIGLFIHQVNYRCFNICFQLLCDLELFHKALRNSLCFFFFMGTLHDFQRVIYIKLCYVLFVLFIWFM